MSVFHDTMRDILEDVQRFLNCTLAVEHLSAPSMLHKESLLVKIYRMRNEYPQLHLQIISESKSVTNATTTVDSLPPYTDMHGNPQSSDYVCSDVQDEYYEVCNSVDLDRLKSIKFHQQPQQSSSSDAKTSLKSGYLEKKGKDRLGGLLNTVQRRWVTLKEGQLYFYSKQGDKRHSSHIPLVGYEARLANFSTKDESRKNACFEIVGPGLKTYQFVAVDQNDAKEWIDFITSASNNTENYTSNSSQIYSEGSQGSSGDSVTGSIRPSAYVQQVQDDYAGEVYESVEEDHEVARIIHESSSNVIEEDLYNDTTDGLPETDEGQQQCLLPPQYRDFYLAVWDWKGSASDELNIKRGDMIKIVSKEHDEHLWWIGQLNGRDGLVPKQFLMEAYEICS